ncbi:hypothetical protein ACEE90_03590 [Corynebacterium phoceense]
MLDLLICIVLLLNVLAAAMMIREVHSMRNDLDNLMIAYFQLVRSIKEPEVKARTSGGVPVAPLDTHERAGVDAFIDRLKKDRD